MEIDIEDSQIDPTLKCAICGYSSFDLRSGFYFCQECGTKQNQARQLVDDHETQFATDPKLIKVQKLKKEKIAPPKLTSWECYNYILRGLVEELLQLGAKEDIKLISLQLWTAYLRRKEIAFFNKKRAELPKLSARFLKRDANILYNHLAKQPRKKRKRSNLSTSTSDSSLRSWRKAKRNLDETQYSSTSNGTESSASQLSSSGTGTTNNAIRLRFSSHARKAFKKRIPTKHIKKHEEDAERLLKCHDFPPKSDTLTENELFIARITIREIYTILAIALNLAEDEIQLVDLVRFIAEGHIGTKNVLQYFPENVQMHAKEILRDINFHRYTEKITYRAIRENIALMAKLLNLQEYRTPNINALARRYINELNLPPQMAIYVERLINIFPPKMPIRSSKMYPAFEARAMAYIVFILKLIFGLDGHRECEISEAAKKINDEIHASSEITNLRCEKLFIWSEWVEFIEMRKVIIAQYNSIYSQQFKVPQRMSQQIEELGEMIKSKIQREIIISDVVRDVSSVTTETLGNLHSIMKKFVNSQQNDDDHSQLEEAVTMSFQASYTPSDTYFKRIRLHASINAENPNNNNVKIPDFMRVDHTLRTLEPYLNPKSLREFFDGINIQLNVKSLPCTDKKSYVGMFVHDREFSRNAYKADLKISEQKWLDNIVDDEIPGEVTFKKKLDCYEKQYMKKLESLALKRELREIDDTIMSHILSAEKMNGDDNNESTAKIEINEPAFDVMSMTSIELFSENNMDPVETLTLKGPRRDLDSVNLLQTNQEPLDIDQEENPPHTSNIQKRLKRSLTLLKSNMDYWILFGHIIQLTDLKKKNLENIFPRSFFWLLETCARTISVDWGVLYEQLMAIEIIYGYGIEPLDDFKDCIRFKHLNKIKDVNLLVNWYRDIW